MVSEAEVVEEAVCGANAADGVRTADGGKEK